MASVEPYYADLSEVLEWRRWSRLGGWVSYASGEALDLKHPVVALVRGWHKLGLVEVSQERTPAGLLLHRFARTKADFPPGTFDPLPPGPGQPPAFRDPASIVGGIGQMAQFAVEGDEHPDWVRFAAIQLAGELTGPQRPSDDAIFSAAVLLRAVAELLSPEGNSRHRKAEISWRSRGGGQGTGSRWNQVLKEWSAAHMVVDAVAAGGKKDAEIRAVSAATGLSEGKIKKRLAQRSRIMTWESDSAAKEAAGVVAALVDGGLLVETALKAAAEATNFPLETLRKHWKQKLFDKEGG